MHDIAQRALRARVERPAGGEHEPAARRIGIDPGTIEAHDRGAGDAKAEHPAVPPHDLDTIAHAHICQEREMRVTMRGINRGAFFTNLRCALELTGPEGERLTAGAGEYDRALAEPRHRDPRDRPGVGPGPRLDR